MPFTGTDLSEIDPNQPIDTELVSQLGVALKETRTALVASFGAEHGLAGEHDVLYTTVGSLPAAGFAGRIALVSNAAGDYLVKDNGSAWVAMEIAEYPWRAVGPKYTIPGIIGGGESWAGIRQAGDVVKTNQDDPQAMWREYLYDGVTYDLEIYYTLYRRGTIEFDVDLLYEGGSIETANHADGATVKTNKITTTVVASGTGWKTFGLEVAADGFTRDVNVSNDFGALCSVSYRLIRQLP